MSSVHCWLLLGMVLFAAPSGCAMLDSDASEMSIQFEEATNASGIDYASFLSGKYENGNEGVYVADVDRDGCQDLVVLGGKRPALFTNKDGTFEHSGELRSTTSIGWPRSSTSTVTGGAT